MTFYKQTMRNVPLDGKTVLVRADYNVPLKEDGSIADDFRIRSSLPTIKYLLRRGCKVVIISHLGRPEGKENKYSLEVVADNLAKQLERSVLFVDDCVGDKARMAVKRAPKSSVVLLENLRFYGEEEANSQAFAKKLALTSGAKYFVQDGFGVVHRAHASTAAITLELPSVAGLLLEKEVATINQAMQRPKHPFVAVMGGAKVSDKIEIIEAFIPLADKILIGGAMANTFLAYKGHDLGKSKLETDQDDILQKIYQLAENKVGPGAVDEFLELPHDVAVANEIGETERRRTVDVSSVASGDIVLDVGDKSIDKFVSELKGAGMVIWNGTLGYAELPEFAHGSARTALALASQPETVSIIGGGDTADFVLHWDAQAGASFSHVSTGGGASLELMSGKKLPGVESLLDA
jgi:phosphoglycerate kinase